MAKRLRVILDIDVEELSAEERQELANDMMVSVDEVPTMKDNTASEYGFLFNGDGQWTEEVLFPGSELFAKFDYITFIDAVWLENDE